MLGLSTPARGFFAVARLTRLNGTVPGGGIDLYSTVPSTAFAGSRDGVREPLRVTPGAVHVLYMIAQLEGSVGDVARKRRGYLRRKVQGEPLEGLRSANVLQGVEGRSGQGEEGVPRGRREVVIMMPQARHPDV